MSDRVGLVLDPVFERHVTGPGHPERPERAARIRERLESSGLAARCVRVPLEEADEALLTLVHDRDYVRRIRETCERGRTVLDTEDTTACPESPRVARLAAGSLYALCREVASGHLARGFAVVRPPGHHAERDVAMGFCMYNNVAVAAAAVRAHHGIERVAIVDWDVHHGNGSQHLFEGDPAVFYFSVHQWPLYPGTGRATERGRGAGVGATLNCPIPPGSGDDEYLAALCDRWVPAMREFRPEFVLVSAGFDPHAADPLAQLRVTTPAFAEATRIVRQIADRHAHGRVVSALEGGYDLDALADCAETHLQAMLAPAV